MKKFMILMLSLAVLFSFAACDNSNTTAPVDPSSIVSIKGVAKDAAKEYLVGDTPDPEDFTFTGYDLSGNVVQTISSTLFESTELKAATDDATFTINGYDDVKVDVPVYAVDKLEVNAKADSVQKTYYTVVETETLKKADYTDVKDLPYTAINKTGLVVTAYYDNSSKTRVLDADEYKAALNKNAAAMTVADWMADDPTDSDPTYTVKVEFGSQSATYDVDLVANLIEKVSLYTDDDYVIYYNEGGAKKAASVKQSATDVSGVKLLATMANGQEGFDATTETGAKFGLASAAQNDALSAVTIESKDGEITLWAKYVAGTGSTGVVENYKAEAVSSRSIAVKADAPNGIEATGTVKVVNGTDYATGSTGPTDLVVKYTYLSGAADAVNTSGLKINDTTNGYKVAGPAGETQFYTGDYPGSFTLTVTSTKDASWTDTISATISAS